MPKLYLLIILLIILPGGHEPRVAYELFESDLIPEGITYSKKTNSFYLSSLHKSKIIKVDENTGITTDFISSGEYGFLSGLGLFVDDKSNELWAISTELAEDKKGSKLFVFELYTAKILNVFEIQDTLKHFLNDLVLDGKGNAYITDSDNQTIYKVNKKGNVSRFYKSSEIIYPNGITISDNGRYLYVASFSNGIRVIDIKTKTVINNPDTTDNTRGIDGLKYFKGSLIGVQNGFQTKDKHKIVQYFLNDEENNICDFKILEENNNYFDTPTTFVIKNDQIFLIANSQLSKLDQSNNKIIEGVNLNPTTILKLNLDKIN